MLKFCKVAVTGERHARVSGLSAEASLQRRTVVIIYVRKEAKTGGSCRLVTLWLDQRASGQDQKPGMWKWRWFMAASALGGWEGEVREQEFERETSGNGLWCDC